MKHSYTKAIIDAWAIIRGIDPAIHQHLSRITARGTEIVDVDYEEVPDIEEDPGEEAYCVPI